eukprot:TRINITY_DN7633_c0_g1_i3.p1 TRINITY_DN7633_c0_g1~~TRINITY_DN7633_c0_g1_i3.p1  ORF type:complete len:1012 (-),score=237.98 TRINITY_DN7633_c0_g1_i3:252-3287(-)
MKENSTFRRSLQEARRSFEELKEGKAQIEEQVNQQHAKLLSLEKENASAKHEVWLLSKELEIRTEEKEITRKSAEAANKQHLESLQKIANLEADCQKLRILLRKKLPGPAAIAQMKKEAEKVGDTWRRKKLPTVKSASSLGSPYGQLGHGSPPERNNRQMHLLMERLYAMEEENEFLKKELENRKSPLPSSRSICDLPIENRLAQRDSQSECLSGRQGVGRPNGIASGNLTDFSKAFTVSYEPSHASISEEGVNEDEASCAESWASALISELENFSKEKPNVPSNKIIKSEDFGLMDDFVEMERLATASDSLNDSELISEKAGWPLLKNSGDKADQIGTSSNQFSSPRKSIAHEGKKVAASDNHRDVKSSIIRSRDISFDLANSSHDDLLQLVLDAHSRQQNMDEVVKKIREALQRTYQSGTDQIHKIKDVKERLTSLKSFSLHGQNSGSVDGVISEQFSPDSLSDVNSSEDEMDPFSVSETGKRDAQSSRLSASVHKILNLIEGIFHSSSFENSNSQSLTLSGSDSVPGYTMRVLQWQNSELDPIIQKAINVCNDLLQGKTGIEEFVAEVGSVLEWLANHFFSLKDVSTIRDAIKNELEWDGDSQTHSDAESAGPAIGQERVQERENSTQVSTVTNSVDPEPASEIHNKLEESQKLTSEKDLLISQLNEEISALRNELAFLRSKNQDLDARLKLASENHDAIKSQLHDSQRKIADLEVELSATKEFTESLEDKLETQITMNEELEIQLKAAFIELDKSREKFTSLQAELEEKGSCFQELEATCLDLQLQLESGPGTINKDEELERDSQIARLSTSTDIQYLKGIDISEATKKFVECQKTILDLEKQFKALAGEGETNQASFMSCASPPQNNPQTETSLSQLKHFPTEDTSGNPESGPPGSPKRSEMLYPATTNEDRVERENQAPEHTKSGLLYGWQLPPDSPLADVENKNSKPVEPSIIATPSGSAESTTKPSATEETQTSSSNALVPYKTKKRSRGGSLSRFFAFSKKG